MGRLIWSVLKCHMALSISSLFPIFMCVTKHVCLMSMDPLALELQMAVSHSVVLRVNSEFSGRAARGLATETSLQPSYNNFLFCQSPTVRHLRLKNIFHFI